MTRDEAKEALEKLEPRLRRLGVHVDLAEPHTLHPAIRERVLAEALRVA